MGERDSPTQCGRTPEVRRDEAGRVPGGACRRSCSGLGLSPSVRRVVCRVTGFLVRQLPRPEVNNSIIDARARASRTCQFGRFGAVELGRCRDTARLPGTGLPPPVRLQASRSQKALQSRWTSGARGGA